MNILTVSTYPVAEPRHGGQLRVANVSRVLREVGHIVKNIGVLGSANYPEENGFCPYPGNAAFEKYIKNSFLMEDWALGELFANDDAYFEMLAEKVDFPPDIIFVEQPWLFKFAERFRRERSGDNLKIFYSSHNIESDLKYTILSNYMDKKTAETGRDKVFLCENYAIHNADYLTSVSAQDIAWCELKTKRKPILAANGVQSFNVSLADIKAANQISGNRKFALYCASAHPPNIVGFFDLFQDGIGCFAPGEKLIVVGSAGDAIQADARFQRIAGLSSVWVNAGSVPHGVLCGLLSTAHSILLPITQGGGSNLKTAEALLAGKHVVATAVAMRGFENFLEAKGVRVVHGKRGFQRAVHNAMQDSDLSLSTTEKLARNKVSWDETLKGLVDLLNLVELGDGEVVSCKSL